MSWYMLGGNVVIAPGGGIADSGAGAPPQAIWQGVTSSTGQIVGWWPPTSGTPDSYNLYRGGVKIASSIVPASPPWQSGAAPQLFYVDSGLANSTAYTYVATAVTTGVESTNSPSLTITTLAGSTAITPTTAPTAATDPATWIVAESLPGGTVWTATNTASNNAAGTGAHNATGCGFQYALSNANIAGGDVIVITAGATYQASGTGFQVPAFTGISGWTYIVSSQATVYNGAGTLPTYSYSSTNVAYTSGTLTGTLSAAATSATLSGSWSGRSGAYPTAFTPSVAGNMYETRSVTYTNGSTAITWAVGLVNGATAAINTAVLNTVTPFDITASMPTIAFDTATNSGYGMQVAPGCSNVRFVGINISPVASVVPQMFYCAYVSQLASPGSTPTVCESIYFDRCVIGPDTATYGSGMSFVTHGIGASCNHLLIHQTYIRGICNDTGAGGRAGGDANGIFIFGGGPICLQNNYIEAQSEGVLLGGTFIAQTLQSHDIVYRYNFNHKPTQWLANTLGESPKNHFELKMGQRIACYGNLHQNNWSGLASEGQAGRSFVLGARDQQAATSSTPITQLCPWINVTDADIHDNQIYAVNSGGYLFSQEDYSATAYTVRVRIKNNLVHVNPGVPVSGGKNQGYGWTIAGAVQDMTFDQNTSIHNPTNIQAAGAFMIGIANIGNNPPVIFADRWTFTNLMLDAQHAVGGTGVNGGTAAINTFWTNYTWTDNLTFEDNETYPATTFKNITYAGVGFASFGGNAVQPFPASQWNVTSGTYFTASTIGGPLGSIF